LSCAGCSPINDPSPTSAPEGPAAEWAGVYQGLCLLNCSEVGASEREMNTTLRLTQARDEIHVQLFLVPNPAYSPKFSLTDPVGSENIINFHIEVEGVFIFHADIHRSGDHDQGFAPIFEKSRLDHSIQRVSQPMTSSCHWIELWGLSTQWFSSG